MTSTRYGSLLNEEEYSLIIKKENDNVSIEAKLEGVDLPYYYKNSYDFQTLKTVHEIFTLTKSLDEHKKCLETITSKKENITIRIDSSFNMIIQVEFDYFGNERNLELILEPKIVSAKKMMEYLNLLRGVDNKNKLLIEENAKLKGIIKTENIPFEEKNINSISSLIKDEKEFNLIKSGIKSINNRRINLKILYKASKDGDTPEIFHSKCDGIAPTITIFKTTNDYIFGGYTDRMWDNKSKVLTGTNTFLFSLNNMKIYDGINGGGIFCHNDLGPWFSHALGADY